MIDEGRTAPSFELPALVDGDHRRVALEEHLGDDVVILAFYPAAFNPGCDVESDLDQLDLFTMQPDVTVLAVGPDTLYANEAFADEYDLHIPLLSDTKRAVAEAYDVAYEDGLGQHLIARAVFVVDHDGRIVYAWSSKDPASLADVDEIKNALGETGGDDTAFSRYRVGHAHYVEGRRAFTSAMNAYGDSEWMIAQTDFHRARDEFEEAEQHFTGAVRFVDDDLYERHYAAVEDKAAALWQAADWLGRSASEYSSGAGGAGQQLRDDAEGPLEEARLVADPIDPDDWPPEEPPERDDRGDDRAAHLADDDGEPATLEVDLDAGDSVDAGAADQDGGVVSDATAGASGASADGEAAEAESAGMGGPASSAADIDDEELAEIEAEIAASGPEDPFEADPPEADSTVVDEPPEGNEDELTGDEPDVDALEADLDGGESGGGTSLEPEPDGDVDTGGGDEEGEWWGDDADDPDASEADDDAVEDELEEFTPESTSLDGIPSEAELEGDGERDDERDDER